MGMHMSAKSSGSAHLIARLAFGDLAPYGLPAPMHGPYRRLRITGVTVAVTRASSDI